MAPADGLVASRSVTLAQVVQIGTEMFKLMQDRRIEVDALVSEADLLKVQAGHRVKITGPTGRIEQGQVRIVAPLVDAKTRLGTVASRSARTRPYFPACSLGSRLPRTLGRH